MDYRTAPLSIKRYNSPAAPSTNEKIATECCHRNSEISPARCSGGVKCIGLSLQVRAFLCPFDGCSSADLQFGSQTRICEKSVQSSFCAIGGALLDDSARKSKKYYGLSHWASVSYDTAPPAAPGE